MKNKKALLAIATLLIISGVLLSGCTPNQSDNTESTEYSFAETGATKESLETRLDSYLADLKNVINVPVENYFAESIKKTDGTVSKVYLPEAWTGNYTITSIEALGDNKAKTEIEFYQSKPMEEITTIALVKYWWEYTESEWHIYDITIE